MTALIVAAGLGLSACTAQSEAKNPTIELSDTGSTQSSEAPTPDPQTSQTDATPPQSDSSATAQTEANGAVDSAVCPALNTFVSLTQAVPTTLDDPDSTRTLVDDTLQQFQSANPPIEFVNDWAAVMRTLAIVQTALTQTDPHSEEAVNTLNSQVFLDATTQLNTLRDQSCPAS
jgi:hypothetical protein